MKRNRQTVPVVGALLGLLLLSCGGASAPLAPAKRGDVVRIQRTGTYTAAQVAALIAPLDSQAATLVNHEVRTYTIVYGTLDHRGQVVEASGSIMVPSTPSAVPMVSLQHGTVTLRRNVSTFSPTATPEGLMGLLMASTGYFVCVPDYLGFGVSTATHPYVHARTLAAAVIDLLIAAGDAAAGIQATANGRLFLGGYSEGGYATLAAHKEIEANYSDRFNLVASAPMAGSYDLSATARSLFGADTYRWPTYAAFLLTSYNEIYGWGPLSDIFKAPYAGMMPGFFDGSRDFGFINDQLPTSLSQLVQESFVSGFLDGSATRVVQAFGENDLLGWSPVAPIRFYHGDADEAVPYQNSLTAVNSLSTATNSVELHTIAGGTHESSGLPALLDMIRWFGEQ